MPKQTKIIETKKNIETSDNESDNDNSENQKTGKQVSVTEHGTIKKRGRPKKTISQQKSAMSKTINNTENEDDEELILHIPNFDDDLDESSDKNIFTMREESDGKSSNHSKNKPKPKTSLKLIDSLTESDKDQDNDADVKELLLELKRKDTIIKKLKSQLNDQKNGIEQDNNPIFMKDAKKSLINLKLINMNDNKNMVIVDKTNICCWWCCHNFDTIPCFIPDRYINDKFYVFGCFCTYNCAMAYNSNMGDYRVPLRNSLIKELHNRVFNTTDQIHLAPAKELLQKFGGPMTIEEFRNKDLLCKKEHKINIPPLIPLLASVEENYRDPSQNPKNVCKKQVTKFK